MKEVINEHILGKHILLLDNGTFFVDGIVRDWYRDVKTQKTWIPKKRSSLVGLIKQIIKEY